jgi:LmbE family N-acetylglucosaminyl deacetylase
MVDRSLTGGVLARCAAEGITTVLVTCTDGRCGDGPGGVKPGAPGHDPVAVAAMRREELEASCAALKVTHLELLGYADSGMMGWPSNDAPGSFWGVPVAEAADRLAVLIRRYQPDVVVTYDENGFYGHPDHIQAHRVTMAAVALTGVPAKVYWTTAPHSGMAALGEALRELGVDWAEAEMTEDAHPRRSACRMPRSPPGWTPGRSAPRSTTHSRSTPARARTSSSCAWARSASPT